MSIIVDTDGDGNYDDRNWGSFETWMTYFRFASPSNFLDSTEFNSLLTINDISGDGTFDVDITDAGSSAVIDGVIFTDAANVGAGTGNYNTFLALQDSNDPDQVEEGFNSGKAVGGASDPNAEDDSNEEMDASKSEAILLGAIPIKYVDGVAYYEFRVDLNEANSGDATLISLDQFKLFVGPYDQNTTLPNPTPTSPNNDYGSNVDLIDTFTELNSLTKVYDMDANGDVSVLMDEGNSSGSGNDDYAVLVPVSYFEGYDPAKDYVYLYVEMGAAGGDGDGNGVIGNAASKNDAGDDLTWVVNGGFHEWNLQNAVIITGTKFLDANGNGVQDEGETGMEGVTIFIDNNLDGDVDGTDGNGILDAGEQFTVTDENGNYSFGGIPLYDFDYDIEINEVVPPGSEPTTDLPITITIDDALPSGFVFVLDPIGNKLLVPDIEITKTAVLEDGGECADETTDVINYTVTVENTGDLALENVVVTDQFEGALLRTLDDGDGTLEAGEVVRTGDTGNDNILSVGETWTYTYSRNVTQNDIDTIGIDGDGLLENTAEVDAIVSATDQPISDEDDADIEVCPTPDFTAVKEIVSVNDGDDETEVDGVIDGAGDSITYRITITNTGNVTLNLEEVADTYEGTEADILALIQGQDADALDGVLQVGETWTYEWTETVDQPELDEICATDETITNSVAATFSFGDPESEHYYEETKGNEVETPVECTPDFTAVKEIVSVNDGDDETEVDGVIDGAGD
ncbi:hypothetical protein, partial [Croceicoccus sp. BE223]|uniref:DUF7507 domain-containing protein n=1 Tax=Croceicoccus sp. BE223 TaxID=2817716 RepID=UPI002866195D